MRIYKLALLVTGLAAVWATATMAYAKPKATAATSAAVEPQALQALQRMSAYLGTIGKFEIKADTTLDQVYRNGQKLQFGGTIEYKVARPGGFMISVATDRKVRKFYYDGKTLTMYGPVAGLYATIDAPPTIRELMDVLYTNYDVDLPLMDLFRWSDPNNGRSEHLDSGILVGYAKINGVDTQHYAFREGGVDWQVWIAEGDRPLPLKFVITSTWLSGQPQFTSVLKWDEKPSFSSDEFSFKPPAGTARIDMERKKN